MATIFLSYATTDEGLARKLEARLKKRGHVFRIDVGTPAAGQWRTKLMNALRRSDVLVPLLSERGLSSQFVASEIGAARAFGETTGQMLVLPVVVGVPFRAPSFVSDYHCFRLPRDENKEPADDAEVEQLADELDHAIREHAAPKAPRVFLSHRHKDEALARALVSLIEAAFQIGREDIRCTSVHPYTLSPGDRTSERLRAEIRGAEVVLGLLSPDTADSKYVLAELGAAWGADIPTFPLLVRGSTVQDVPEPLSERHSLSLERESDGTQLVDEIARVTTLTRKRDVTARIVEDARKLADLSRAPVPAATKASRAKPRPAPSRAKVPKKK